MVAVDRPPKAPKLTGTSWRADVAAIAKYNKDLSRWAEQAWQRMGANTDVIASTTDTANTAAATASASQAGATIPTEGGAVTLNPADPLSYTIISGSIARIIVADHTRSDAGAPLVGAFVTPNVARNETYYVYYSDAADAGGAQTFLASTSLSTVTGTAGYRIIGTIFIEPQQFVDRGDFQ